MTEQIHAHIHADGLVLRAGDTLIVGFSGAVTTETAVAIKDELYRKLPPGIEVTLITGVASLAVARPGRVKFETHDSLTPEQAERIRKEWQLAYARDSWRPHVLSEGEETPGAEKIPRDGSETNLIDTETAHDYRVQIDALRDQLRMQAESLHAAGRERDALRIRSARALQAIRGHLAGECGRSVEGLLRASAGLLAESPEAVPEPPTDPGPVSAPMPTGQDFLDEFSSEDLIDKPSPPWWERRRARVQAAERRVGELEHELNEQGAHFDALVQEYRQEIFDLRNRLNETGIVG